MYRMTEEQFYGLKVGDEVVLYKRINYTSHDYLAQVIDRTAKTVKVRAETGLTVTIRKPHGNGEYRIELVTPEWVAARKRKLRIERISSYLFQLERQHWRDVPDEILDLFDVAVDAYQGHRRMMADREHDTTRTTPNQPKLESPAKDEVELTKELEP